MNIVNYKQFKNDLAVIEIKPGQDPYADPYAEARKEKTANRTKNLSQQIRNSGKIKNKKQMKMMNEFGNLYLNDINLFFRFISYFLS